MKDKSQFDKARSFLEKKQQKQNQSFKGKQQIAKPNPMKNRPNRRGG